MEQQVFAYHGTAEGLAGSAVMNLLYAGTPAQPHYFLQYDIPAGQVGYAGLAFRFDEAQDLGSFRAVEFYLKDISNQRGSVRITGTGTGEMELHYELANFEEANLNALKEIGFLADNHFSLGRHSITVYDIRFVR